MTDSPTIGEEADGTAVPTLNRDVASLSEGMPESVERGFAAHQPRLFES